MDEGVDELTALQSENMLKISRNVMRITEDDHRLKALLAASNDRCFILTSNPHVRKHRDKWITCLTRRQKNNEQRERELILPHIGRRLVQNLNFLNFVFQRNLLKGRRTFLNESRN